jgi:hypothetical protein
MRSADVSAASCPNISLTVLHSGNTKSRHRWYRHVFLHIVMNAPKVQNLSLHVSALFRVFLEMFSHSVRKEIYRLLWDLNVRHRVWKNPPLDSILSKLDPLHSLGLYVSRIRLIFLPYKPMFPELPFFSSFNTKVSYSCLIFPKTCYMFRQYQVG